MKAIRQAIWERKLKTGWWCMGPATITRPGSAPNGMAAHGLGDLDGRPVGRLGTTGVSISDLVGVAALAGSVGGDAIQPGRGGDRADLGIMRVVPLPGDAKILQARQVTFTLDQFLQADLP